MKVDTADHPAAFMMTPTGKPHLAAADVLADIVLSALNNSVSTPDLVRISLSHLAKVSFVIG